MSKRLTYILAATLIAASCAEFEPVFTGKYPDPPFYNETEQMFDPSVIPSDKLITIADLAKKFKEAGTAAGITDYNVWGWTVSQELWSRVELPPLTVQATSTSLFTFRTLKPVPE